MIEPFAIVASICVLGALLVQTYRIRNLRRRHALQINEWKHRFEQDLKKTQDEQNLLLDALGDAFIIVDDVANIRFANAAARDLGRVVPFHRPEFPSSARAKKLVPIREVVVHRAACLIEDARVRQSTIVIV